MNFLKTKRNALAVLCATIFFSFTVALQADQIVLTPASAIGGSNSFGGAWNQADFGAQHVADNQAGPVSDVFAVNYWLGPQGSSTAYFVIDLGAVYNLQSVDLFNTHNDGANDRSTGNFQISVSNSITSTPSNGMDLVGGTLAINGTLTFPSDPIPAQSFNFGPGISARYLRFDALSFPSAGPHDFQGVGLNEIRVFSAVPETGNSLVLFGIAIGLTVGLRRILRATAA